MTGSTGADPMRHKPVEAVPGMSPGGEPQITSLSVLAARLFWTFLGPVLLAAAAYQVGTHEGWLTVFDALFAMVVCCMLLARWIEQRTGEAATLSGRKSTAADFRHYGRLLIAVSAAAWVTANLVSNVLRA
jgi:hypothetical protein